MELSIKQSTLKNALQKIKVSLGAPTFVKLKAGKKLILASQLAGFSTVIIAKDCKIKEEGVVTLDFESLLSSLTATGDINLKADDLNFYYSYGRCKGNIALLDEIKFEHKKLEDAITLDNDAMQISDYLSLVTLKDIKFKLDDAPVSVVLSKNHLGLYAATSLESVIFEKEIKNKSKLETSISPKILKKIFDLVKPAKFNLALTEATAYVSCEDKDYEISFSAPLPESYVTSIDSIKMVMKEEIDSCKDYIYVESGDLKTYFSKLKAIADLPSSIDMEINKGELHLNYSATKGRITESIKAYKDKYKTTKKSFQLDYELMINNLQKLSGVLKLYFCERTLWIETVNKDEKFLVMVALV